MDEGGASEWSDILGYRDFFDVPRLFWIRSDGGYVLFDSPFLDQIDEYDNYYSLRFIERDPSELVPTEVSKYSAVGRIPVSSVTFDASRRSKVLVTRELRTLLQAC